MEAFSQDMACTHIFRVILVGTILALGSCLQREPIQGRRIRDSSAKKPVSKIDPPTTNQKIAEPLIRQLLCPLMGEEIDKEYYVDYDGKRIYVCCAGCVKIVKKKPEKFIKQLESQGIELENIRRIEQTKPNKEGK